MISVIVPALDEEARLPACLGDLAAEGGDVEVLVVDGGSRDATRAVAASFPGVRVLAGRRGRARQMNLGAAAARGDVLWFLHADSRVPPGALLEIERILRDPRVVGGAFRFAVDSPRWVYRLVELGVRIRSEVLGVPYGDQGLFVRREVFDAAGGYADVEVMEDLYLVRTLRRRGGLRVLPLPLVTSARRWERRGVLATTVRNLGLVLADWLGWSARPAGEARQRQNG